MKHYTEMVADLCHNVKELFPWDLEERLLENPELLILDVREPYEYEAMHIPNSLNVPRGILEPACEWDYEETVPALVNGREREIVIACRSGYRSVLAAHTLQIMGFKNVASLKTGVKGWNDAEQPLLNGSGEEVDIDNADDYFVVRLKPEQHRPEK